MASSDRGPGWTASKRLDGKVAVVIGAGQSPGEGVGKRPCSGDAFRTRGRTRARV